MSLIRINYSFKKLRFRDQEHGTVTLTSIILIKISKFSYLELA